MLRHVNKPGQSPARSQRRNSGSMSVAAPEQRNGPYGPNAFFAPESDHPLSA